MRVCLESLIKDKFLNLKSYSFEPYKDIRIAEVTVTMQKYLRKIPDELWETSADPLPVVNFSHIST